MIEPQRELIRAVNELGVSEPWITTYNLVGVLDVSTRGQVQPHSAHSFLCMSPENTTEGWEKVFTRMGPGVHHVVLAPDCAWVSIRPCVEAANITDGFWSVVYKSKASAKIVWEHRPTPEGPPVYQIIKVTI